MSSCMTCLYHGNQRQACIFGTVVPDDKESGCCYVSNRDKLLSSYYFNVIDAVIHGLEKPADALALNELLKIKQDQLYQDNSTGRKYDEGKLRWDLLPLAPIEDIIRVLMFGAKKYGDWNWMNVQDFRNRYYSALMRHITAWYLGEELDKESGLSHLSHALCNLVFLDCIEEHNGNELPIT